MKTHILRVLIGSLLLVRSGCASNPDAAGQALVPVNGQDARSPSQLWHYVTPSNTLGQGA